MLLDILNIPPKVQAPVEITREKTDKPILYAYAPSKKLSTCLDVECLKTQTLLLFSHFPFAIKNHNEPNFASNSKLPCLVVGDDVYSGREIQTLAADRVYIVN